MDTWEVGGTPHGEVPGGGSSIQAVAVMRLESVLDLVYRLQLPETSHALPSYSVHRLYGSPMPNQAMIKVLIIES